MGRVLDGCHWLLLRNLCQLQWVAGDVVYAISDNGSNGTGDWVERYLVLPLYRGGKLQYDRIWHQWRFQILEHLYTVTTFV